jgi:hypothetical protein
MIVNHIKEKARALSGAGGQSSVFDMKVEKRSNCVYTPLQISPAYIVKIKDKTALH